MKKLMAALDFIWLVHCIAGGSPAATRVDELTNHRAAGFKLMLQAQHGRGNGTSLRTRNSDHANASAAGWRGDGDNRVVEIHK